MAIAFDAATTGSEATGNLTYSHTCTGSNLILFVGVNIKNGTINGVPSYNGTSMTLIDSNLGFGSGPINQYLYYLVGPTAGAHSVVINVNGSPLTQSLSASYTGSAQTGIPDATNKTTITNSSISTTVTTSADNCWVFAFGGTNAITSATAGSGFTLRNTYNDGANAIANGIEDTNGVKHPAGAVTTAMSFGSSAGAGIIGASFAPILAVSVSDTSVSSDSVSMGISAKSTETSVSSDSVKIKIGFGNVSKASTTWTNVQKS